MGIMKMKIFTFIFFFLVLIPTSFAATTSFSGNRSIGEGGSGSVNFYVNGNGELIGTVGGYFSSSDSNCISITSVEAIAGSYNKLSANSYKYAFVDFSGAGFSSSKHMVRVNYSAVGSSCSASINFANDGIGDISGSAVAGNSSSIGISVLSNNNNLTSLSTSVGGINFNASTTSYSLNVDSNVTSVNISATASTGASVSGTGSKSLGYGSNKFNIVVTAQSGSKKTYSITVNRKDDRSSNNNLSSLTVNGGELSPSFSNDVLNYKLLIPFEMDAIDVSAITSDSKASVSVSGNSGFISEETSDVTIRVTAENGGVKTFVISVTRGKDPNKPLNTNNYLATLNISSGVLSPSFNKEQTEYLVWLPYEVDVFNLEYSIEDFKWANSELIKPEVLEVGENNYIIKVTAEDGTLREYNFTVMRGYKAGTKEERDSLIKELNLSNISFTTDFNSEVFTYYYKSSDEYSIDVVLNYADSEYMIYENEDVISIYVMDINGGSSLYVLKPYKINILVFIIPSLLLFPILFVFFKILKKIKKKEKKIVKEEKVEVKKIAKKEKK